MKLNQIMTWYHGVWLHHLDNLENDLNGLIVWNI